MSPVHLYQGVGWRIRAFRCTCHGDAPWSQYSTCEDAPWGCYDFFHAMYYDHTATYATVDELAAAHDIYPVDVDGFAEMWKEITSWTYSS